MAYAALRWSLFDSGYSIQVSARLLTDFSPVISPHKKMSPVEAGHRWLYSDMIGLTVPEQE